MKKYNITTICIDMTYEIRHTSMTHHRSYCDISDALVAGHESRRLATDYIANDDHCIFNMTYRLIAQMTGDVVSLPIHRNCMYSSTDIVVYCRIILLYANAL